MYKIDVHIGLANALIEFQVQLIEEIALLSSPSAGGSQVCQL